MGRKKVRWSLHPQPSQTWMPMSVKERPSEDRTRTDPASDTSGPSLMISQSFDHINEWLLGSIFQLDYTASLRKSRFPGLKNTDH